MPEWIAAIGGCAGFVAFAVVFWDRWLNKNVPAPQVSLLLLDAREFLQDIVNGGQPPAWFIDPQRSRKMQELNIYGTRIRSDEIYQHFSAVMSAWDSAWLEGNATPENIQRQVDYARAGVASATRTIDAINAAIRKAPTASSA